VVVATVMEQGAADESAGAAPQSIDSAAIDPEMGNDGEKFFAVAGEVSTSLSTLHHEDLSGAFMTLAKDFKEKAGHNLGTSSAAIRNAEVTKGWDEFVNSFDVKSVLLVKTPLGIAQACAALLFIVAYFAIFLPTTYAPPLLTAINDRAVKPAIEKATPIFQQGKRKVQELAVQFMKGGQEEAKE
jgi:hypothetical protein